MTLNKAKQILINQARTLRAKAAQKRREADRLEAQARDIEIQAQKLN